MWERCIYNVFVYIITNLFHKVTTGLSFIWGSTYGHVREKDGGIHPLSLEFGDLLYIQYCFIPGITMCMNSYRYMTFCASVITFDSDIIDKKPRISFVVGDNWKIYIWNTRTHTHPPASPPTHPHPHSYSNPRIDANARNRYVKVCAVGVGNR